jgi:hypothetical protein
MWDTNRCATSSGRTSGTSSTASSRGKAPLADLEGAHQTSIACHLANIAMRTGRVIEWDPARGDIVGDAAASALLTKTYRAPWDQQLRAAMGSA